MSARDLRRLRQMWAALDRLAEGKVSLRDAVASLAEDLRELEDSDPEWRARFEGPWAVLRNASAASPAPEARVIDEATASLRALVAEILPADERDE
jgi:hypothetical protein